MKKYCILTKNDTKSFAIKKQIMEKIVLLYDEINPDYIITVGGDGTILGAIQQYYDVNPNIVIFGLHTGHLGFFANYTMEEFGLLIENVNEEKFIKETASLLNLQVDGRHIGYALNEVSILCPTRTLILDVLIDEEDFERFYGTGLCISTSHGSTAYNKSLHGSVVDTNLDVLQLTEIAGINSNAYRTLGDSLVLNKNRVIRLKNSDTMKVTLTYDNQILEVEDFKEIKCFYNEAKITFASYQQINFVKRIKRTFL